MKHMHLIWIIIVLIQFPFCQYSFSQGLKIKEFKQSINDGSAFHAPLDAEGHSCGLIKVRANNSDLHFKGNIIGDVENKVNEYWVFMPQGSKSLTINHPNYMPFSMAFADYGIDISSKTTYILTLEETRFKKEKTEVTIVVKPEDANLFIDDIFVDNLSGNGYYQLYITKGEHICNVSKIGYRPNVQIIQTGKTQQNLSVELESVLAELEIKCITSSAELYIDGEYKGNGSWKGKLLAGEHKIEACQNNFKNISQMIVLEEKESKILSLPELKRTMAILHIETSPSCIPVTVDGSIKGTSPIEIEIETGIHLVTSESYGCSPYRGEVVVEENKDNNIKIALKYENIDYQKAYEGDKDMIASLAIDKIFMANHWSCDNYEKVIAEAIFWAERHPIPNELYNYSGDSMYDDYYTHWIEAYCEYRNPGKALLFLEAAKRKIREKRFDGRINIEYCMSLIGNSYLKIKRYDEAIRCYKEAKEHGYEGLAACYEAKGDKQKALLYYNQCLNTNLFSSTDIQNIQMKIKALQR